MKREENCVASYLYKKPSASLRIVLGMHHRSFLRKEEKYLKMKKGNQIGICLPDFNNLATPPPQEKVSYVKYKLTVLIFRVVLYCGMYLDLTFLKFFSYLTNYISGFAYIHCLSF